MTDTYWEQIKGGSILKSKEGDSVTDKMFGLTTSKDGWAGSVANSSVSSGYINGDLVLSGKVAAKDGKSYLDINNNKFLVNDGTTNRLLLGNNMGIVSGYGLFIAKSGNDVETTDSNGMFFDSTNGNVSLDYLVNTDTFTLAVAAPSAWTDITNTSFTITVDGTDHFLILATVLTSCTDGEGSVAITIDDIPKQPYVLTFVDGYTSTIHVSESLTSGSHTIKLQAKVDTVFVSPATLEIFFSRISYMRFKTPS